MLTDDRDVEVLAFREEAPDEDIPDDMERFLARDSESFLV
jgi:hypothetical protein